MCVKTREKEHKEKHAAGTQYCRREARKASVQNSRGEQGTRPSGYGAPEKSPPEHGKYPETRNRLGKTCRNAKTIPQINRPAFLLTDCLPIYSSRKMVKEEENGTCIL